MRAYITAVANGDPSVDDIADRLYIIPVDFHDRLTLIFGRQPAEEFLKLLSMNIILTETIINAMKNGDQQAVNTNTLALYRNADALAGLLRGINPFWSDMQWRNLLYNFINMTLQQTTAFMSNKFKESIDIYDRLAAHSQLLGDYMANGIIQYLVVSRPAV